jgi:hypothetical protein
MRARVKNPPPTVDALRRCIEDGLPHSLDDSPESIGQVFFPSSHLRAIEVRTMLVIGIRGAGKTHWSSILSQDKLRASVHQLYPNTELGNVERCVLLSWAAGDYAHIPGHRVLTDLIKKGNAPESIWRAVVAAQLPSVAAKMPESWKDRVEWIDSNVELSENLIREAEEELMRRGKQVLLVFDALDRTTRDPSAARQLLKGLFQTLLDFRRHKGIRLKAFIRPDMTSDEAMAFTDSSKLFSERANLEWGTNDLYGLLWQKLANNPNSSFRELCQRDLGIIWHRQVKSGDWYCEDAIQQDDEIHRKLIRALAGDWMGNDYRKGDVYKWLPKHLGDGQLHVSPRSFLTALREASVETSKRFTAHTHALHHEGIREGVRAASKIRVKEVSEDYPWANTAMDALSNLNVPCESSDIRRAWRKASVIENIEKQARTKEWLLPWSISSTDRDKPVELEKALIDLGIFEVRTSDGRLNVPPWI